MRLLCDYRLIFSYFGQFWLAVWSGYLPTWNSRFSVTSKIVGYGSVWLTDHGLVSWSLIMFVSNEMKWIDSVLFTWPNTRKNRVLGWHNGTYHATAKRPGRAVQYLWTLLQPRIFTYFARVCRTQHCSGKKSPQFKWFSWFYPCCKPSHLKSFKFHPLGSSFFRNYVVWCPAADSEKISFKSSIRAVGRTHPALNAQPMLKYLENPKKLLKIGLQGNGLKI